MKTYQQFKHFINSPQYFGVTWEWVKHEAIKDGFKRWQVDLYSWWYHKRFNLITLKRLAKKILKLLWYIFVAFGLMILTYDLRDLIKSAARKNKVITLSYIARTCNDYPSLCERIADKGGYNLVKKERKDADR